MELRPFASRGFAQLPAVLGKQEVNPLDCLDELTEVAVGQIASWHLQCLQNLADKAGLAAGARQRIVDKMPDNYSQLGWIVTAFPHAKIIHCRRDVRDIAVSCWVTQFKEIRWAFDLTHLAERPDPSRRKDCAVPPLDGSLAKRTADGDA